MSFMRMAELLRKAERDYCLIIKQRDGREERMITVPSSITEALGNPCRHNSRQRVAARVLKLGKS